MNSYTSYIILIFIIKIIFILLAVSHIYLKTKGQENTDLDNKILYWKKQLELIFKLLMALLLIFLFRPTTDKNIVINGETRILLFLFGFILLITAPWQNIISETKWFKSLQKTV